MTDFTAPYPDDTRAKGWRFEVDMEKVKQSDTWLRARTGMVRANLLLLWSEAWQQTPCGTLPNDDELISLLLDMAPEDFVKHKPILMRGWILADNGRLYHDTITERVLAMLVKRAKDAKRTADSRAKRSASQSSNAALTPPSHVTDVIPDGEFDTKHQAPEPGTLTSVPEGTGGEPPVDQVKPAKEPKTKPPKTAADIELSELWGGMKLLMIEQKACTDHKAAGVLIGKQASKYGRDVFSEAARETLRLKPIDALTYLIGLCETAAGKRQKLGKPGTTANLSNVKYTGGGDDFATT